MAQRELENVPLFWHQQVPCEWQEIVAKRRRRYVTNAWGLEEQGFIPATQVTLRSGWLLGKGEDDLLYMVKGRRQDRAEKMIQEALGNKELEFRCANGAVVPLVEPSHIQGPKDLRATKNGFTIYVREVQKPIAMELSDMLHLPRTRYADKGFIPHPEHVFVLQ